MAANAILTGEQAAAIRRLPDEYQPLVKMTLENGIKMTVQDVIGIWQLPNPWRTKRTAVRIVWLEEV